MAPGSTWPWGARIAAMPDSGAGQRAGCRAIGTGILADRALYVSQSRQVFRPTGVRQSSGSEEISAMALRSTPKELFKSPEPRHGAEQRPAEEVEERPRNIPANSNPTEGFALEVDGKIKSQYPTSEAATASGAELKRKFPVLQVTIYDAAAKTRTPVKAAE